MSYKLPSRVFFALAALASSQNQNNFHHEGTLLTQVVLQRRRLTRPRASRGVISLHGDRAAISERRPG